MAAPKALIIGASRGIGLGLVAEFAGRGWEVVGTVRGHAPGLEKLAADRPGAVRVETVDTADVASGEALRDRLRGEVFDLVLVNAGVAGPRDKTHRNVDHDSFAELMITNALGPVRLAELLKDQVRPDGGVVGLMTSQLGSVGGNTEGGMELYRASKAALNSLTRSFAARHRKAGIVVLSLHPGWVKTDMGGPNAAVTVADSARGLADVVERALKDRKSGYFDYRGETLPW